MFFDRQRKNLEWKRNSREIKEESRHNAGTRIPTTDIKVLHEVHVHACTICEDTRPDGACNNANKYWYCVYKISYTCHIGCGGRDMERTEPDGIV